MADVLIYDTNGGFGPRFNAERDVGGAEIHELQIAEYLVSQGLKVDAYVHTLDHDWATLENGVLYADSRTKEPAGRYKTVIVIGSGAMPNNVMADKWFAFQVVDPRPCGSMFDHQKLFVTQVCVSDWQANLFRAMGHTATHIPVPLEDSWYGMKREPVKNRFVCVSSWNKGAHTTLLNWDPSWGELAIGSAYSHPENAEQLCRERGATWLGKLKRAEWIAALASGEAVARICTIQETFGVVDAAAGALGMQCYTLCPGDPGSLPEMGATTTNNRDTWAAGIRFRQYWPRTRDANDFRASKILPQWLELVS